MNTFLNMFRSIFAGSVVRSGRLEPESQVGAWRPRVGPGAIAPAFSHVHAGLGCPRGLQSPLHLWGPLPAIPTVRQARPPKQEPHL